MGKINLKIVCIGDLPRDFELRKIRDWKSSLFQIDQEISRIDLNGETNENWQFHDQMLSKKVDSSPNQVVLALINEPLEDNYYCRVLTDRRAVITFFEVQEILESSNVPLENFVIRSIYRLVFVQLRKQFSDIQAAYKSSHHATRGCLNDMNGIKHYLSNSCVQPIICHGCEEKMRIDKVDIETIRIAKVELTRLKKNLYFRMQDLVKKYPLRALLLSSLFAFSVGIVGNLVASALYDSVVDGRLFPRFTHSHK